MTTPPLPPGWRIQQEFRYDGPPPDVELVYAVKRWMSWNETRFLRGPATRTGWRTLHTSRSVDEAERWARDTIAALTDEQENQ